jgi:hypothetical protein
MNVFSVQRIALDGSADLAACVTVEAECTVKAGELVLSEPLSLHGQVVKAKVWYLKDDYTPQWVNLYAAGQSATARA